MRNLKNYWVPKFNEPGSFKFGDFNIDTLEDEKVQRYYKNLNFLFFLDQKLRKLPQPLNANDYMNALAKTIRETVDKFAPGKRVEKNQKHFVEALITNEYKNAIVKRNKFLEKLFQDPTETSRERYKIAIITLPI